MTRFLRLTVFLVVAAAVAVSSLGLLADGAEAKEDKKERGRIRWASFQDTCELAGGTATTERTGTRIFYVCEFANGDKIVCHHTGSCWLEKASYDDGTFVPNPKPADNDRSVPTVDDSPAQVAPADTTEDGDAADADAPSAAGRWGAQQSPVEVATSGKAD